MSSFKGERDIEESSDNLAAHRMKAYLDILSIFASDFFCNFKV